MDEVCIYNEYDVRIAHKSIDEVLISSGVLMMAQDGSMDMM